MFNPPFNICGCILGITSFIYIICVGAWHILFSSQFNYSVYMIYEFSVKIPS